MAANSCCDDGCISERCARCRQWQFSNGTLPPTPWPWRSEASFGVTPSERLVYCRRMDLQAELDHLEALLADDATAKAGAALSSILSSLRSSSTARRATALHEIAARVGHPDPHVGAHLALLGGAVLEAGAPARPLALAVREPLVRSLQKASRFLALARSFDALTEEAAPLDAAEVFEIGNLRLPRSAIDAVAQVDGPSVRAFFSLAVWYRPVVASWSRDVDALRAAEADPDLRAGVEAIGGASEGTYWLSTLLETMIDVPFVILLPEVREAFAVTARGVVDNGQLSVLLSEALADPLARVGASGVASAEMLAVMRGEGPQKIDATYTASFHLYPWQSMDPASMTPEDGRFEWRAPGGTGNHSLPPDFLPNTLEPLRGVRVLLLVGPNAGGGIRFSRVIGGCRTFESLRADLMGTRRLGAADARRWFESVRTAVSA